MKNLMKLKKVIDIVSYILGYEHGYDDGVNDSKDEHISAIAEGLRKGSSKCGKIMAQRRWNR